ncbi:heptatricopeptide repeat-containing protein HPR1, putative [Plasmodium vivax]|uniref:Heptatricopeptide repeat-containing protein HPR1 n=1 Tax=Plasmodium vivax (strain Salvador I) TaxID=126793 RepID=A5KDW7_PLAVS|nr:hypothetical protein, conserved [Plasmodium vivax]EDL42416.1 hypothetical protein, conserved [Plasmodium vivax]CAI7719285.1 heptatricopeptide repeat-containing protein HPR1, putative [Plasmodium vivax]|eukprot:XP_001608440.1 hypothetical protein [Plasmodium vivax Sal-1]
MIGWAKSIVGAKPNGWRAPRRWLPTGGERRRLFGSSSPTDELTKKIIIESNYGHIKQLKSQQLRVLSENCCNKKIRDVVLWSEISRSAINRCDEFKYFDAVLLLSSFEKMNMADDHLYKTFAHVFVKQINHMEPRHLILLINLYCKANLFPRVLFVQVFHAIVRYCSKFYPEEYTDLLICFASLNISNGDLMKTLCKSMVQNVTLFDYNHLCCIVGCLRRLGVQDDVIYYVLDEKQQKELKLMTTQELFDCMKKVKLLKYSWELYEKDLLEEFKNRIAKFQGEKDVNQLEDPFVCLNFLVSKQHVTKNFLIALSKWCASHVYEYPSRSAKRPLAYQLIMLYQLMKEHDVNNYHFIEKAIHRFVVSRGGLAVNRDKMAKPVSYQRGRKYVFARDPLEGGGTAEVGATEVGAAHVDASSDRLADQPTGEDFYLHEGIAHRMGEDDGYDGHTPPQRYAHPEEPPPMTEKQRAIALSLGEGTERKKPSTHSHGRHFNFKLRQRPKRVKNAAVPVDM